MRLLGCFLRYFGPAVDSLRFFLAVVLNNHSLRLKRHKRKCADLRPFLYDQLHLIAFRQALRNRDRPPRLTIRAQHLNNFSCYKYWRRFSYCDKSRSRLSVADDKLITWLRSHDSDRMMRILANDADIGVAKLL